jgi:transposase, IS5 family
MRPRERSETGEQDLFRSRLDQIIDMKHPLVTLGRTVDWGFLEERFGEVYTDDPGRPPLPTRLMAGLAILKHTYDLSDEVLCERWVENRYYQYFCGEEFFQHRLVFDRSSLTRWRNRMGEERLAALIQESLSVAARTKAIKPSELSRVIVDTTVQPKNVTFPTDAKLLNRAREKLVRLAKLHAVPLRHSYARVGKFALIRHQRYAHAKQFKRANRALKTLRTYLGRVIRDIGRKIEGNSGLEAAFAKLLPLARRVREQQQRQRGPKVYSLHAPEVECFGKGKAHRPYEFGVKVSVATRPAGSTAKSRIRYVRVMGLKEDTVQGIGFQRLAIFRPRIIAGNAHTPRYAAWLGRLIPGRFGTIEQDDIGRAFVAEFISSSAPNGVVYLENGAMRQRSRAFK